MVILFIFRKKGHSARGANYWLTTSAPIAVAAASEVERVMVGPLHYLQIFKRIIRSIFIQMVNNLIVGNGATQVIRHYKSMLSDITNSASPKCIRMVWPVQVNIAVGGDEASALPSWISIQFKRVAGKIADVGTTLKPISCRSTRGELTATSAFAFHSAYCIRSTTTP